MIIINPGTEPIKKSELKNALKGIKYFVEDLDIKGLEVKRNKELDSRGWFGFTISKDKFSLEVDIPGSSPEVTRKGEPFKSSRIYVDGSSWLWGYGLDMFRSFYKDYLIQKERK